MKPQLSDSEIQKLREDLSETDRRRWLCKLIRTGALVIKCTGEGVADDDILQRAMVVEFLN